MTCPRYVLLAADDASLPRAAWLAMAGNLGEHKVFEIPGGHEVLYTDPDSLARALAAIAHDLDRAVAAEGVRGCLQRLERDGHKLRGQPRRA